MPWVVLFFFWKKGRQVVDNRQEFVDNVNIGRNLVDNLRQVVNYVEVVELVDHCRIWCKPRDIIKVDQYRDLVDYM